MWIFLCALALLIFIAIALNKKPKTTIAASAQPAIKKAKPFEGTIFSGDTVEPTDKRITKTLAVKMYSQVIRLAYPGWTEKEYRSSAAYFGESISFHWSMLEQQAPTWEIDDLKQNIEDLEEELSYEAAEDNEDPDQERIDWLRGKIKLRSEELQELELRAKKYKNRDLRFFLASALNNSVHGTETEDTETIAQKTDDFWKSKPKPTAAALDDEKDGLAL
ncbi:hypothetical protein [Comamonas sp.]|uniref:hypothetical protein n=1 Tax=Comamonas sp. TaxID=34028 RepID=UPI00258ECB0A|nr:hypothetical protein [Comamonas sp.]